MADEQPSEIIFRASKRRKILRKPTHQDDSEQPLTPSPVRDGLAAEITKNSPKRQEDDAGGVTRIQRKPGAKRLGIAFSSTEIPRNVAQDEEDNKVSVVVSENGTSEVAGNDRFIKPMGRAEVTEDKHMMAYVDSKLAEIRPASTERTTPNQDTLENDSTNLPGNTSEQTNASTTNATALSGHPKPGNTTYQVAQERSRSNYQRPTKRRPRPPRPETDVARDSMIDQIMGDNLVPHYDRTLPSSRKDGAEDTDNDAAAAEAFKAQLLADLERNKRRPPLQKSAATTTTGPKLGGSRAQREKMRALEEAKAAAGKKQ